MNKLTLTFDNGPEPEVTGEVLAVLRRHRLRSCFFVLGQKLADPARRALAERARADGHWIGNHTYSHSTPLGMRTEPDAPELEIGRSQELIGPLAHPNRWFRPIGGGRLDHRLLSPAALDYLVRNRYSCVLWNCVPRDWAEADGWTDTAWRELQLRPWTLMVLHDLPTGAMKHLDTFLARLLKAGVEIVQEFPPDCVPIVNGQIVRPMAPFVAAAP
ncbi:MAG TPA: polysaccharide deacetylase family protein [Candidatus Binataceae bacterium]|nr:polysaccharide deacetylase family protein [Candidatus Binataceae bacterium]